MEGLSLVDEVEGGMVYDVDHEETPVTNFDLCLVGRFVTNKAIRTHIMKERLSAIWTLVKGVTIQEVETGLFLFQFYHKLDLVRSTTICSLWDAYQRGKAWRTFRSIT